MCSCIVSLTRLICETGKLMLPLKVDGSVGSYSTVPVMPPAMPTIGSILESIMKMMPLTPFGSSKLKVVGSALASIVRPASRTGRARAWVSIFMGSLNGGGRSGVVPHVISDDYRKESRAL